MLHWFSKKFYLKDLLKDFVDIHNHILPGIDDGAQNIADALALISKMRGLGIKQFIPTPHVMQDFYPNTVESISNAYMLLLESLDTETRSNITINPAAEYMLDIHFESFVKNNYIFTLKSKYVLIELSYFQPPLNLEILIDNLRKNGYIPVLAHPERYVYYHNHLKFYHTLKRMGCFFQLNLLSLGTHYGKQVQKTAIHLVNHDLIDFAGTDIHNMNQAEALEQLTLNKALFKKMDVIIKNTNTTFTVI